MTSYNRDYWMSFGAHQKASVGDIKFSAVNYDHLGWILCNGALLNVDDFQFLFNMIGYSFGGSGAQFRLPNPAGRVPGVIGTGYDDNVPTSTMTTYLGQSLGEYQHRLTIPEMPSHNHGVNPAISSIAANNSTSIVSITINDPTHTHSYTTVGNTPVYTASPGNMSGNGTGATTGASATGVTLNNGTHAHTLNPSGEDKFHNNVQPTLFIGNMFIYTGLPRYGASVYQTGKNLW